MQTIYAARNAQSLEQRGQVRVTNDTRTYRAADHVSVWVRTIDRQGHEVKDTRFAVAARQAASEWLTNNQFTVATNVRSSNLMLVFREVEKESLETRSHSTLYSGFGNLFVANGQSHTEVVGHHLLSAHVFRLEPHARPDEISRGFFEMIQEPFFPYEHWSFGSAIQGFLYASLLGTAQRGAPGSGWSHSPTDMNDAPLEAKEGGCWPRLGFTMVYSDELLKISALIASYESAGLQLGDSVIAIEHIAPAIGYSDHFAKGARVEIQIERDHKTFSVPVTISDVCLDELP